MTKQLSPAAQSIYNAAHAADSAPFSSLADVIAATIHAAADQVVPSNGSRKNNEIRSELLTIAAELETL